MNILHIARLTEGQKLWQTSPSTIGCLLTVSKDLYLLARPFHYRRIRFTLSRSRDESNEKLMELLLRDKQIQSFVREINIKCFPSELPKVASANRRRWQDILQLIPRLIGLRHLSYIVETSFAMEGLNFEESRLEHQYRNLTDLIRSLQQRSTTCRLSLDLPAQVDLISVLPRLVNNSSLYSLSIVVHSGQVLAAEKVLSTVSTCPNLRELRIKSCNFTDSSRSLCIGFPGARYAALQVYREELLGSAFVLEHSSDPDVKAPLSEFLDLKVVEKLSLLSSMYPLSTISNSTSLRSLHLDLSTTIRFDQDSSVEAGLAMLLLEQRLEQLSLTGGMHAISIESLASQKHTLRTLSIHEHEDETGICKRLVLSDYDIGKLGKALPDSDELSLDLNYDGSWVSNIYLLEEHISLRQPVKIAILVSSSLYKPFQ